MKTKIILLFAIVCISILSCSTKHVLHEKIIYKDDDFRNEYLKNNSIIIFGISSRLANITDKERINYSMLLSDILNQKKLENSHSIDIMHTNQLIHKIGEENFIKKLKEFDQEKILQRKTLQLTRDTIPSAKYLLHAKIENENIIDEAPHEEYINDDKGGKKLQITYKKTYMVTVEFQIYDILLGKLVFHNEIKNETKRTEQIVEEPIDSVGDLALEILLGGSNDTDPAKIERKKVLAKTFERFAKNILE